MTDTSNWQKATEHAEQLQNSLNDPDRNIDLPLPQYVRTDIRLLLDHLETEYVGATVSAAMRRLRDLVGYGN